MRVAGTAAALLAAVLTGCAEPRSATTVAEKPALPPSPAVSDSPTPSVSPSPASPSPTVTRPSATGSPSVRPATRPVTTPEPTAPKPTFLRMTVAAGAGRLDLVRGGAAEEFTVTLHNGNTRAYGHLRLAFQMEILVDGTPANERPPSDGFVLERWDAATGAWRGAELRIANDALPPEFHEGGVPLARDTVRTERYRLRAGSAGPVGSTPLMIALIDTDAPAGASAGEARPASFALPHTTRRD